MANENGQTESIERLQRFFNDYLEGQYAKCIGMVNQLDFEMAPPCVLPLMMICYQRLGRSDVVEGIAGQVAQMGGGHPVNDQLLAFLLGKVQLQQVLVLANNDVERCLVYCIAGEAALTRSDFSEALNRFAECEKLDVNTTEKNLARTQSFKLLRREMVAAFMKRDYKKVRDLVMGGGVMVQADVGVLAVLSMQRLGEATTKIEDSDNANAAGGPRLKEAAAKQWDIALHLMITGSMNVEQVLRLAEDDDQRCFTLFCSGARLVNMNKTQAAKVEFQRCLDLNVECDGAALSRVELQSLEAWG